MSRALETRQELRPVSGDVNRLTDSPKWFETLENRQLLSATGDVVMQPAFSLSTPTLSPSAVNTAVKGYTPAQIKKAYGFDQLTLSNGVTGDGSGQTIAIVDAYDHPNILNDLKTFSKQFSLDDPILTKVSQTGSTTNLPKADAGWAQEIALDVEWAHAIAPKAKILLVEANSASLGDLLTAVDYARNAAGVSVVSMSWGTNEFFTEGNYDHYFTTPIGHQGVTFVASSGDDGSFFGPTWPSVSSNVLAVGGTTLRIGDTSGTYSTETGWSGSGGGVSRFISEPSYQSQYGNIGGRGAPDVSLNANPLTGYAVYSSVPFEGVSGWSSVGGTSAGAPQWAALIAVANQGRALAGAGSLDGATGTLPAIYSLYNSSTYSGDFHDITTGRSSFRIGAHAGWDAVTGLGSPKGDPVVDALAAFGLKATNAVVTNNISTPTVTTTTAKPAAASAVQVQAPAPQSAPQQRTSLFSSVRLNSSVEVISEVTPTAKITTAAAGGTSFGFGESGVGELGGRSVKQAALPNQRTQQSNRIASLLHDSRAEANPLRHLMPNRIVDDNTIGSPPGRVFAPSSYDAAALAASAEGTETELDWKQLGAILGTGILIASYVADAQRKKRAVVSSYSGIQTER